MKGSSSVLIIYKHAHPPAYQEAHKLQKWFREKGVEAHSQEMEAGPGPDHLRGVNDHSLSIEAEWAVVLGGDGTLLAAARKVGRFGVPLLGVNLGGLGFLTGVPLEHLYPAVELMLEKGLDVQQRLMLETKVFRQEREVCRLQVLNDVVVNKRTLARIIDLDVKIDGEFLTTFRADGLIISTPTGSTAYNLSAGGPILYPAMEAMIITPICPFTLTNRPLLIPDSAIIEVSIGGKHPEERVVLTFDGQVGFDIFKGDRVIITKSHDKIKLLTPPGYNYFQILRQKLMWGGSNV
ncbi:MAG TPA: NAD(+) kinase [Desulfobacterales bacterium]|nr:NAD(+) kinase [Desulfobacterales bacterium]